MSELRVDSLKNRTGGDVLPSKQLAKAWVNFNGTGTVAIRSAFNVTSITDNGTGDYTVNYTTPMGDANYCILGSAITPGTTTGIFAAPITSSGNKIAGSCRCQVTNTAAALADLSEVNVAVFGN